MGNKSTKVSVFFMHIGVLFTVCLIASNVLETKQIDVLGLPLTGGLLVFPISYIINDVVSEVWGLSQGRNTYLDGLCYEFLLRVGVRLVRCHSRCAVLGQ